jgi:hypothetical protein
MTSDTEATRTFYGELFGWVGLEPDPQYGGYFLFTKDGVPVAGCMPAMEDLEGPREWSIYLATKDARKTSEAVSGGGGQIMAPAMEVGDLGTMVIASDISGARVGIWQPNQFQGFGVLGEPGTPAWFELLTRDYEAVVNFYGEVFGCETHVMSDTAEFRYTTFNSGEDPLAGVMDAAGFLPEDAPSSWSVYFWVNDADAAAVKVVELGGSILQPAHDTPYGRLVGASDVDGARFNIMGANEQFPAR